MRFHILAATLLFPVMASAQTPSEAMRLDLNAGPSAPVEQAAPATTSTMTTAQMAQQASPDDKDHMVACSIIYQRISDMYQERGEREKADSFVRTAYAYSQTADILYTEEMGMERAYDAITERMSLIADSLNRESQSLPNGDLGVIEKWLGWCDERGEFVQNMIESVNNPQ